MLILSQDKKKKKKKKKERPEYPLYLFEPAVRALIGYFPGVLYYFLALVSDFFGQTNEFFLGVRLSFLHITIKRTTNWLRDWWENKTQANKTSQSPIGDF